MFSRLVRVLSDLIQKLTQESRLLEISRRDILSGRIQSRPESPLKTDSLAASVANLQAASRNRDKAVADAVESARRRVSISGARRTYAPPDSFRDFADLKIPEPMKSRETDGSNTPTSAAP